MADQSESSGSPSSSPVDVFFTFRGNDIRTSFTDRIYGALNGAGIRTFVDDSQLERGGEISDLLEIIQQSKLSIVVFSTNYAFSTWCLDELAKILECRRTKGHLFFPVYYDVDPMDVRYRTGSVAEAFKRHKERFGHAEVKRWKAALKEAAHVAGYHRKTKGHEARLIEKIVKDVIAKVHPRHLNVAEHLVGIDLRVDYIYPDLSIGLNDVRFIGLYGVAGIGKTTIAKAIYNRTFHHFESSCFIENVKEALEEPRGLLSLQEQLILELLSIKNSKVADVEVGYSIMKALHSKRVLIVLDDLDHLTQLQSLAYWNWFGPGTRIIITTRNEHLLKEIEVDFSYEVVGLSNDESLQLFSWHAFRRYFPLKDFLELSKGIVSYARGIPLVLEILGKTLFQRSIRELRSVLKKLQQIPKIGYAALDDDIIASSPTYSEGREISDTPIKWETDTYREEMLVSEHVLLFESSIHSSIEKYKYDTEAAKVGVVSPPSSEGEALPVPSEISNALRKKWLGRRYLPPDEIKNVSYPDVTMGFFSVKETGSVEIDPDPAVGIRTNINKSVEPFMPVAKSELLLSSNNKNDECSPIDNVEVERHDSSPGDQTSPNPGINVNSSIYQTVQKILGCLRDGTTRRIGIYGNGGIGKSTLLKALFNHEEAQDMFDSIIWVTVSTYSSTKKIQNQVAEQVFSHPAGSDTNLEAISRSFRRKKVLFLLDDVSEKIDLDAVGIPNPNQENGCRIIFTTRSLDVCQLMAVDKQFDMDIVSMEEAWELFHDQVGYIIDSPDIEPYARAIVAACGGLPLTIVVTGRALREENNTSMWQHALWEFLSLVASSKPGVKAEIQKLKFSYNKLKSRDVKDCFLYCALIQQDHGVNISKLVKYFTNEGLVARSLADPYEKGNNIVKILLSASLLVRTDDGLSVKMHDVIRELALVIMSTEEEGCQFLVRGDIKLTLEPEDPNCSTVDVNVESELLSRSASEGHQFLLGAGAGLTEPPANEKWEQAKMIFLMDNDLSSLPDNLSCPKLLTLCFQRNNRLRVIPKSFFVGMPHLQILNLSRTRINSLPPSVFKLKLLKVLLLYDCKRFSMLSPEIGALEHLELLDLRETEIYNLPNEIGSLTCLKHLLVSFYGTSNNSEYAKLPTLIISKGIISRLLQLNELSIDVYPGDQRWTRGLESVTKEVLNLKQLKNLSFYFPEVNLLELFIQESPSWKNEGLAKFKFIVGHNVKRIVARVPEDVEFFYNQQNRCLRFVNGETVPSSVEKVLSCSTAFYLDHHLNIQSLSEFGVININALEVCIVRECHELKAVIHSKGAENSTLNTFPVLEILVIHYSWNLRSIWAGPMPSGSLSRLKFLSVHTCPQLPYVLTSSMLQNLYNLEVLSVEDCQAVTAVILEDTDFASAIVVLPRLRKLRLHYLPNLVSIWKGTWPFVEHISFYNCPNLKSLPFDFELIRSIKVIQAEKMWWDELIWEDTSLYLHLQAHFTEISYEDL